MVVEGSYMPTREAVYTDPAVVAKLPEITGFYADPNGVLHGFLACPTGQNCAAPAFTSAPEPASLMLAGLGLAAAGLGSFRRLRRKQNAG